MEKYLDKPAMQHTIKPILHITGMVFSDTLAWVKFVVASLIGNTNYLYSKNCGMIYSSVHVKSLSKSHLAVAKIVQFKCLE